MTKDEMYLKNQEDLQEKVNNFIKDWYKINKINISHGMCVNLWITKSQYVTEEKFYLIENFLIVIQSWIDMLDEEFELKTIYELEKSIIDKLNN